jgi:hypothetical protein
MDSPSHCSIVSFLNSDTCGQPLPNSPEAAKAMRTALELCGTMGDIFKDDKDRSSAFDKAMDGFLPGVGGKRNLEGNEPIASTVLVKFVTLFEKIRTRWARRGMPISSPHAHSTWRVKIWKQMGSS